MYLFFLSLSEHVFLLLFYNLNFQLLNLDDNFEKCGFSTYSDAWDISILVSKLSIFCCLY